MEAEFFTTSFFSPIADVRPVNAPPPRASMTSRSRLAKQLVIGINIAAAAFTAHTTTIPLDAAGVQPREQLVQGRTRIHRVLVPRTVRREVLDDSRVIVPNKQVLVFPRTVRTIRRATPRVSVQDLQLLND